MGVQRVGLFYEEDVGAWTIDSPNHDNMTMIMLENKRLPVGSNEWESKQSECNQGKPEIRKLLLKTCKIG